MDWKETLGAIAPTLATALGGPLAGAATKFLANELLGDENANLEDIELSVLGSSSQDLAKLKELDQQFKIGMKKLDIDVFALEVQDRDSARTNHKHSNTPTALVYMLTVLIAIITYLLFNAEVPERNENNLYMLLGALTTAWIQSISYWTGTTRSSADKTRLLK